MADIFVSYARADKTRVAPLVAALEAQGWSVWWDPAIVPGQEFDELITRELEAAPAVIVVWTPGSVGSRWVRGEAREGADRRVLVPIRFENARLPLDARSIQTIDFDRWGEDRESAEFRDLVRAVEGLLRRAPERAGGTNAGSAHAVSIAVLPFLNMSSDREQEYFSDGLSEEMINQLAQIKGLRVAGRTSSFAFKGKNDSFRVIGEKLGVNHVLEGSVRRAGERVRITAQLIKCGDGYHLWSEKFDRQIADVFEIQDEIAQAVAKALRVTLGIGESTRVPGGTENVEAYDLMLRARAVVRRREMGDAQRAVSLLREALVLDPSFALAWNVIGNALTSVLTFDPDDRHEVFREIEEALERSIALAPDLWTAHEARANLLELRHDWVGAELANAKSRSLAPPSMREPIISRAHQLAIVGRISDSIPFSLEALRIEPLAPSDLQYALGLLGRDAEAETEYERNKKIPTSQLLNELFAMCRMMVTGNHQRAKQHLSRYAALDSDPAARTILEVFDEPDKARAQLRDAIRLSSEPSRNVFRLGGLARFAGYFGEHELALSAFRTIAPNMIGVLIISVWDPLFAPMRKLPGFKDFVRDLNLATYWRTTGQWGEFARPVGDDDFEIFR